MVKIPLDQWFAATTEQRAEWLENDVSLTYESHIILGWALAFKDQGAHITDEQIVKAYLAHKKGLGIKV